MIVERSVMEQPFEAVMAVFRDGQPVVEVVARFEVSRRSAPAWIRRYETGGLSCASGPGSILGGGRPASPMS